ncbi:MAG: N-acetyl-gamma-glutamyl-phosphate reductase [Rhodobacteraceae bacterium]|nr:N-acetyl-gamma-glutamyl-phosphate reductase [Paracoccaceae bacterium]
MVSRVFIDGEAGTTGLQIRERLVTRRDIELLSIPDHLRKDASAKADVLNSADAVILCLPDDAAKESVSLISNPATRVVDASTAHRVADGWAYGFAEMDKAQGSAIAHATRVANPGCWPQGVIAFLRPLIQAGLLPADYRISVSGISGYSGGGKAMIADYEGKGDGASVFAPYGLQFAHKHLPEMKSYSLLENEPLFMPAVGNYYNGMLTAIPLDLSRLNKVPTGAELHAAISDHYSAISDGFVEVAPLADVNRSDELDPQVFNGTNGMRLHVFASDVKAQAVLIATYDNLGKGASGAAVQNLNLMLGVDAKTSLAA